MRRLVAAVAVTSALLVAGCSTDKTGTTAGATPAVSAGAPASRSTARPDAGAAAAADAALSGNTAAVCAQARTTGTNAQDNFAQDRKLLSDAQTAKDKAAVSAAKEKASRDVENYAYALGDMSKLVADPTVKQALATMSTDVTAAKGDLAKIGPEQLGKLAGTLAKACGNG
jgi:hypothetical protein